MAKVEKITEEDISEYTEILELPSGFIPYDFNSIYIRPFTVGEILALQDKQLSLDFLISLTSQAVKDIDLYNLSLSDFKVLVLNIGYLSVKDSGWTVKSTCTNTDCLSEISKHVTVFDLDFEDLNIPSLPLTVDVPDLKPYKFDVFRVKHQIILEKLTKDLIYDRISNNYYNKSNKLIYIQSLLVLSIITNIDDVDATYNKLYSLDLTKDQVNILDKIQTKLVHYIKPVEIKCEHCNTITEKNIILEIESLFPYDESEDSIEKLFNYG